MADRGAAGARSAGRKLRVLSQLPLDSLRWIEEAVPGVELHFVPREGEPPAGTEGEVLLTFTWGSPNLGRIVARGVRWVHTIGTGVDAFPLREVGDRVLTCSRGASALPIAEWVLAMLLAFEKRLPESWLQAPPERWNFAQLGSLHGKTLGLVGIGGIGQQVALRARPFGMRVLACRRKPQASPIEGVEIVPDLATLLAESDHVVLAAPSTASTRRLINASTLETLKRGAHLVNIARGSLVDHDALREALDDGRVALASLDTVEPEPLPEGHWLFTHPNVRLSAHISWSMPGAIPRLLDSFVANLARYIAGESLEGVVDLSEGY